MTAKRVLGALGVLIALVLAIYLLAAARFARRDVDARRGFAAGAQRLSELGARQLAHMRADNPQRLPLLQDACRAKLPPTDPTGIVSYFGEPEPEVLEQLGEHAGAFPRNRLVGASTHAHRSIAEIGLPHSLHDDFFDIFLWHYVTEFPQYWPRRLELATAAAPLASAQYLVVNRVVSARVPNLNLGRDGSDFGLALIHVRVVETAQGSVVCEGMTPHRPVQQVGPSGEHSQRGDPLDEAQGRTLARIRDAYFTSIQLTSLEALCSAGGSRLCEQIGDALSRL